MLDSLFIFYRVPVKCVLTRHSQFKIQNNTGRRNLKRNKSCDSGGFSWAGWWTGGRQVRENRFGALTTTHPPAHPLRPAPPYPTRPLPYGPTWVALIKQRRQGGHSSKMLICLPLLVPGDVPGHSEGRLVILSCRQGLTPADLWVFSGQVILLCVCSL